MSLEWRPPLEARGRRPYSLLPLYSSHAVPVHDHTRVRYSYFINSLNPSKVLSTACGLPLALCAVRAATSVEVRDERPRESRSEGRLDGRRLARRR